MAANVLWAHLLRKEPPKSNSPSDTLTVPPLAPLDKTGTSVRMLVHDTRSNLEKFSARVDTLTNGVDTARKEIGDVQKLFESEHERVLGAMADITARCQMEIKQCIGTPAQSVALEAIQRAHVSTEQNVQALHKRVDALQAVVSLHLSAKLHSFMSGCAFSCFNHNHMLFR
ncbi:hypothetical protein BJ138DRAFT_1082365 [Hygrophoropsis aurantiaca]|uniref:Uncharacterized protein n=1 Tax=Hygrophoropsis aurantiaca TaxID=72124 RepID=A0ACB8AIH5_9AGAM|nr:hypothetical protein BJ138DRAFT_1082365 [Hygrophoropsis aurantiaca]